MRLIQAITSIFLCLLIVQRVCRKKEYLEIFQLITQSLSHKNSCIYADYLQLGLKMEDVKAVISDILAKRTVELSSEELGLYGEICQYFDTGFESFVKKLIQTIVVVSDSEKC